MSQNKVALVTGGGGFLATQHIYALSQLNCKIILIDINKKKLINIKIFFLFICDNFFLNFFEIFPSIFFIIG